MPLPTFDLTHPDLLNLTVRHHELWKPTGFVNPIVRFGIKYVRVNHRLLPYEGVIHYINTGDPSQLVPAPDVSPAERNEAIAYAVRHQGLSYASAGAPYGLSRQRVKQILDALILDKKTSL